MKYFRQTDLFRVLLSAAASPQLRPDPTLLCAYKKRRLERALQALRTRNLWLYTEGLRTDTDLNSVITIYTQPAGTRLMLIGYADNFRYGKASVSDLAAPPSPTTKFWPQEHRVRIVGREAHAITEDLVPSQAGIGGEPRYTAVPLTCPIIIEPEEQIAVDLGYDTAATAPANIPPQAFIFFCLKVADKFSPADMEAAADIKRAIENSDFQRGQFLNCVTETPPNAASLLWFRQNQIIFNSQVAGGKAIADTRVLTNPILITGIGTNLGASKITIVDTATGYSFSLNRAMQSSALNFPDYEDFSGDGLAGPTIGNAPSGGPIATEYYQLPMPHLLRAGASLHAEIVNGGDAGAGPNTIIDPQSNDGNFVGRVLFFQGITV